MNCGKCGQALREGVRFCEKCGARVAEPPPAPSAPPTPPAAAGPVKVRLCGNCGSSVISTARTCKWCGASLK